MPLYRLVHRLAITPDAQHRPTTCRHSGRDLDRLATTARITPGVVQQVDQNPAQMLCVESHLRLVRAQVGFEQVTPLGELTVRWTGADDGDMHSQRYVKRRSWSQMRNTSPSAICFRAMRWPLYSTPFVEPMSTM